MAVTSFISRLKAVESSNLLSSQLGLPPSFPPNSKYLSSPTESRSYLLSIYPALRRHYLWFRRTQKGQLKEWGRKPPSRMESYRWRGRTEHHVLTSGLDDYPRALPPHVGELHVDLMCWMGFFARTMGEIAEYLGEEKDLEEYRRNERNVVANIEGESSRVRFFLILEVHILISLSLFLLLLFFSSSLERGRSDVLRRDRRR